MPDTDPLASPGEPAARDPEVEAARARVMMRLLGEDEGPTKIGRFVLLEKVAEGGMGVVFAAYDAELDRRVAVKVIKSGLADGSVQRRIVREAQAMAKLSHPNVAQVYEVGEHQHSTFIAMEFVRGTTLRGWQGEPSRSWREVLAMYVEAGRGLAAAHAAGLVHRDFKPDNAIVGQDGRVRVLDFGLARADASETTAELETRTVLGVPEHDALGTPLTKTGSLLGTPAYMAPEQFLGGCVDAKADQFAFCVALWEGLHGERPFAGATRAELVVNVTDGRVRSPPNDTTVPSWVRAVLMRGLAVAPPDRFAAMDELLAALGRDPTRRRMRIAGVLAIAAVGGAAIVWDRIDTARTIAGCAVEGAAIAEAWGAATREPLHAALVGTGVSYAETTWERLTPWLDDYASRWETMRTRACLAFEVEHTQTPELHARATECLDERRFELASLVATLTDADEQGVQRAVLGAAGLPTLAPCEDERSLAQRSAPPDDAATRASVTALRARFADANALRAAGRYADGLALAVAAIDDARALGVPALLAEAELRAGRVAERAGEYARAESLQRSAYFGGVGAGADEIAQDAAIQLVSVVGYRLARPDEGLAWAEHAEALFVRLGRDRDSPLFAALLSNTGHVHHVDGAAVEALAEHRRALAIQERALGPDHVEVAISLDNIGAVQLTLGDYDGALAAFQRDLEISESLLGPDHPDVAGTLNNLGNAHFEHGAHDEALAYHQRALAIFERALGPDHPVVAACLDNIGRGFGARGALDEALDYHRRALAISERSLGPDHPDLAGPLNNLGNAHYARGDYDEALAYSRRVLDILERAFGPDHPHVAGAVLNLGNFLKDRGAYDDADAHYRRALDVWERTLGPDHPNVALALENLGNVAFARGAYDDALIDYERVEAIRERALGPDHHEVAAALGNLGATHVARGEYDEALAQYRRALEIGERALGPDHASLAYALTGIGQVELARGRSADAIAPLERALALREQHPGHPIDLAETRFALARALSATFAERPRARTLAQQAAAGYRSDGKPSAERLAEVERWLAEHSP